jgi:hypothetical protein
MQQAEAKLLLNLLKRPNGDPLADHHHSYQHDKGFQPTRSRLSINFTHKTWPTCSVR